MPRPSRRAATRRAFLGAAAAFAALGLPTAAVAVAAPKGRVVVRYLGWAGVVVEYADNALFIDPQLVFRDRPARNVATAPVASQATTRFAAVTHLHADQFDPVALRQALSADGNVIAIPSMAAAIAAKGIAVETTELWEPYVAGGYDGTGFTVVPVPAADGFGDAQVSWVVRVAGRRFFHGGDTIWHGHWRRIARAFGPFDAVFLPINGFEQTDQLPRTSEPYSLTPEQAVEAGRLLEARVVVPIHFGRTPSPIYIETVEPEPRFLAAAKRTNQAVRFMRAGDSWELEALL
jgi:L-ascorbate metabolism protein UlaG (beta-lactamase superfamily)